jgi:Na+/H+ antiporter NhaA
VSAATRRQGGFSRRTAWERNAPTPLREFLRTETGGAAVLLAATIAALVWVNVDSSSYDDLWEATLSVTLGDEGIVLDLREWVNAGLMTFFFFVAGLEARREFDLGELREHRRLALPVLAAVAGMAAAVGTFLAFNAGHSSAQGWGVAMSTDTAFALGLLALFGSRVPARLRAFILTIVIVDDLLALVVIATVYTEEVTVVAVACAAILFAVALVARAAGVQHGMVYFLLGLAIWVALHESGVEPVIVGLAFGLLTYAYPAPRRELDRVVERFRRFREQPTPELERLVREGLRQAISPNDRLAQLYHPWTSYVIVPLFALANAGIAIDGAFLERAASSPITLGILFGYVLGKPIGIVGTSYLVTRVTRGRIRPPVGWASVGAGGAIAGIGFTVALLVATLAFEGPELEEAKLGILAAAAGAALLTWLTLAITSLLPEPRRTRALLGSPDVLTDLAVDVDRERDHIRGPREAPVTVVEYGDFECPYCGRAEPVVRELLSDFAGVRYVWRHLPLTDVHPHAGQAAEAAEAAADQGAFWEMHDLLLKNQDELEGPDLVGYAQHLGLDVERFIRYVEEGRGVDRVAEDVESADLSGVTGTPTFFINGRRHYGAYDIKTLSDAVRAAGAQAVVAAG